MARKTFDVVDVTEILVHWQAGRSQKTELPTALADLGAGCSAASRPALTRSTDCLAAMAGASFGSPARD
jgi:hypothetical protein